MNIHEYQAKALLHEFGVPISKGVECSTALPIKPFCPASTAMRSVPGLITEAAVRTRTNPGRAIGAGTSVTLI